jgi:transcription initiation factor IIE alpha subunit
MIYHYNIQNQISLDYIHEQVALSLMEDKNIDYCRWDEDEGDLEIYWTTELSDADYSILTQIVNTAPII